jgi:tetratricopeptide (TPR) repeat protein
MDQQTVELMCLLQAGTHDADTWVRIEALVPSQRQVLAEKPTELADLGDLLEAWAAAAPADCANAALLHAAAIAEEDLDQLERAVALYQACLERNRTEFEPYHRLEALLQSRGEHDRLDAVLAAQAEAMRARTDIDPFLTANAYQRLGQLRLERHRLDGAIEAYEQALELAPDNETLSELAGAYRSRGAEGDRRQAADLYCALGDVLADAQGIAMLEQALDLVPEHDEALESLEAAVPDDEKAARLTARWQAYVEHSANTRGVEARRALLAPVASAPAAGAAAAADSAPDEAPSPAAARVPLAAPIPAAPRDPGPDRIQKTLLGFGKQEAAQIADALSAFKAASADRTVHGIAPAALPPVPQPAGELGELRVPPLYSRRPPSRDERSDPEAESDWPDQLPLSNGGLHSALSSSSRPASAATHASSSGRPPASDASEHEPAQPGPTLLSSSPPSYAFNELAAVSANTSGWRRVRRLVVPVVGAALVGISAGAAIAYGVRSTGEPSVPRGTIAPAPAAPAPAAPAPAVPAPAVAAGATPAATEVPSVAPAADSVKPETPAAEAANANIAPKAASPKPVAADAGEVRIVAKQLRARGGLSPREVGAALEGALTEIESCYDSALATKSSLRGALKLSWAIDRSGRTSKVRALGGSLKDATVERCSVDVIRGLEFPRSKKRSTHVVAPLAFQTKSS